MKQMLAIVCLVALLFTGCEAVAPTQNSSTTTTPNTVTTAPPATTQPQLEQDSVVSLRQEIENAWYMATNTQLGSWYTEANGKAVDGVRHYGSYDGYDVIYYPTFDAAMTQKRIGKVVFKNSCTFDLYAYSDGEFYDLQQAYDEGWLSEEALAQIAQIHSQYLKSFSSGQNNLELPDEVESQMKIAFLRQYVHEEGHSEKELMVISYGEYDGAYVAFISGILNYSQAFTSEKVGKFTFHYPTGQKLLVFYEGELMRLVEAYEQGILSDEALMALHKRYNQDNFAVTE